MTLFTLPRSSLSSLAARRIEAAAMAYAREAARPKWRGRPCIHGLAECTGARWVWRRPTIEGLHGSPRFAVIRDILLSVAIEHGLTVADLKGSSHSRPAVIARHEACYRLYKAGLSTTQIGRALGGRDHTTALHGIRRHRERMAERGET